MAEGNGIDLGSIFGLLPQVQEQMKGLNVELKTGFAGLMSELRAETAKLRVEMHTQRAEIRAELRAEIRAQGAEFRQMVGRVEEHLALPPIAHP